MQNQLKVFDGRRFDGVMDFMLTFKQEGFTDEFDHSLILRMLWNKVGEINQTVGKTDSKVELTMKTEEHALHGTVLKITLHSSIMKNVAATMDLFVRSSRIAVSTNVLTEEVKPTPNQADVLAAGVYWFEAEKSFKACKHFDKVALKAFRGVYRALAPKGDDIAVRLQITAQQRSWRVEYRQHGVAILVTQFEFNKK